MTRKKSKSTPEIAPKTAAEEPAATQEVHPVKDGPREPSDNVQDVVSHEDVTEESAATETEASDAKVPESEGQGGFQESEESVESEDTGEDEATEELPDDETPQTEPVAAKPRSKLLWPLGVLGILLIAGGVYTAAFSARALPNVQLAGQSAAGKSEDELKTLAEAQAKVIKLTFKTDSATETTIPTTAGITFDAAATAKKTLSAKKQSLADRLQFWRTENVPLAYKINRIAFDAYMQKHLMSGWKLPVDAKLAFNPDSKQYDVVPATPGQGVHMYQVTSALDTAVLRPSTITIPIKPIPTNARIGKAAALAAQKKANDFLTSDVQMFHAGKRVFYFEPAEIDTLLDIIPKPESKSIEVSINGDRVQQFVDTNVTSTIARAARDQISIVNPNTGEKLVLQEGVRGQKLVANKTLAGDIIAALKSGNPMHADVEVEEGGYGEKTFTGVNRWAEVNLTRQEAYMHLDDQIIQTFRISSGRAATPSDPGEWAVSRKFAVTTMRGTINGESYVVPNVPWVSYFNPDGEAFHGAYWHNNFGTPMSHGCINMTVPDAHMMYNFTYIGMRVSVHY
ncbi:MAG: L,D-transpeptidase [Candidatus Saccharimonadales bacterium]